MLSTLRPPWPAAALHRRAVVVAGLLGVLALPGSQGLLPSAPVSKVTVTEPMEGESYYLDALWPGVQVVPEPVAVPAAAIPAAPGPYGVSSPSALTASGIPAAAYRAYQNAASELGRTDPACGIGWSLIAGIGRVESNHGRYGGSSIGASGIVSPPILGVRLDGSRPGTARISDSDDGRYDGDTVTDRAVGPMQFLPGTWGVYGGGADPQDMNAAALAAGRYLCAGSGDLTTASGRWAAVFRYNHSDSYVSLVLSLATSYETGKVTTFPSKPAGTPEPPAGEPAATTPGPPPGVPSPAAPSTPAPPATGTGPTVRPIPSRTAPPVPSATTSVPATSTPPVTTSGPVATTPASEPATTAPATSAPATSSPAAPVQPSASAPAEPAASPAASPVESPVASPDASVTGAA